MTIQIIKSGTEKFSGSCDGCGCRFTYGRDDLLDDHVSCRRGVVYCPECGSPLQHLGASGTRWPSRTPLS